MAGMRLRKRVSDGPFSGGGSSFARVLLNTFFADILSDVMMVTCIPDRDISGRFQALCYRSCKHWIHHPAAVRKDRSDVSYY